MSKDEIREIIAEVEARKMARWLKRRIGRKAIATDQYVDYDEITPYGFAELVDEHIIPLEPAEFVGIEEAVTEFGETKRNGTIYTDYDAEALATIIIGSTSICR
jgi:hypothetical protein